jgi:hypothetical protein
MCQLEKEIEEERTENREQRTENREQRREKKLSRYARLRVDAPS